MHFFFFFFKSTSLFKLPFYFIYTMSTRRLVWGGKGIATDSSKQCCQALLIETSRSQAEEQSQAKRGGEERQREERSRGSTTV